jgi:predicted component of type VI protein secretion system
MPPQLLALDEGTPILLDKPIILIGRHQECDIQITSRKISRRHCCIAQVNDQLIIRDLSSTNGIRINGVRVVEGPLNPGDELIIGHLRFEVQWHRPGASSSAARSKKDMKSVAMKPRSDPLVSTDMPIPLTDPEPQQCLPMAPGVAPPPDDLPLAPGGDK